MFYKIDADWSERCESVVSRIGEIFDEKGLGRDRFGLVALRKTGDGTTPDGFSYRGDWVCYPCSLVKAFHLVHALKAIDDGRVEDHEELSRAMRDMILWSSNTATNYVIDVITGTTGDTLLDHDAFLVWRDQRERLNRFFTELGWPEFSGCNITQKLMDDVRYGREAQYAGRSGEYLNVLTPLAAARLFLEIFNGTAPLSQAATRRAEAILLRDRQSDEARKPHFQVADFLGGGVPADAAIWSKAGRNSWTGDPRASYFKHDLIRIVVPGKAPIILCLMTQGKEVCEDDPKVFPEIGRICCEALLG